MKDYFLVVVIVVILAHLVLNVDACGMSTHIEISIRAQNLFNPVIGQDLVHILKNNQHSLEAGSFFPDWGYGCRKNDDASEAAHWPPFWNASVQYIREKFQKPYSEEAQELIAFIAGAVSHGVADAPWHDLDSAGEGFIRAMADSEYHGNCQDAHTQADTGAEFVLAHMTKIQSGTVWKTPTNHLIEIYKRVGIQVKRIDFGFCMMRGYMAVQAVREFGKLIYPKYAPKSEFLVDKYTDYFRGGLNDMSFWVSQCWHSFYDWLSNGPINPFCKILDKRVPDSPSGLLYPKIEHQHEGSHRYNGTFVKGTLFDPEISHQMMKQIGMNPIMNDSNGISGTMEFTLKSSHPSTSSTTIMTTTTIMVSDQHKHDIIMKNLPHQISFQSHTRNMKVKRGGVLRTISSWLGSHECTKIPSALSSTFAGNIPYAALGKSLTSGDWNNDGIQDFAIGAPYFTQPGSDQSHTGVVYIIHGHKGPWSSTFTPNYMITQLEVGTRFGYALATFDCNGDGIDDLVVSSPSQGSKDMTYNGRIDIYLGQTSQGLSIHPYVTLYAKQMSPIRQPGQDFNYKFSELGEYLISEDVNGDGIKDLIIGSPSSVTSSGGKQSGEVFIVLGGGKNKKGKSSSESIIDLRSQEHQDWVWRLVSPTPSSYEWFGTSVAVYQDWVIIGAPGGNHVYYYQRENGSLKYRFTQSESAGNFGGSIAVRKDTKGGEYPTIIISAPSTPNGNHWQSGKLSVFRGPWDSKSTGTTEFIGSIFGSESGAHLGLHGSLSISKNGDVWVGEPFRSSETGRVYRWITSQNSSGVDGPHNCYEGDTSTDRFGSKIILVDINGDGKEDALIASEHSSRQSRMGGAVTILFG